MIYDHAGISLNPSKQDMVYSRLARRLRATGINNFKDYLALLESNDEAEWQAFVNALTTNLTSFFREPHHFPLLAEHVLKQKGKTSHFAVVLGLIDWRRTLLDGDDRDRCLWQLYATGDHRRDRPGYQCARQSGSGRFIRWSASRSSRQIWSNASSSGGGRTGGFCAGEAGAARADYFPQVKSAQR